MKRWIACSCLSLATVAILVIYGLPRKLPQKSTGGRYWSTLLRGGGRQLNQAKDRVDYYSQGHHGWSHYWTTTEEIRNELDAAAKKHLDILVKAGSKTWDKKTIEDINIWDLKRFRALTGYDPAQTPLLPVAWWAENRGRFKASEAQARAYLDELDRQTRERNKWGKQLHPDPESREYWDLIDSSTLGYASMVFSEHADRSIKAWNKGFYIWGCLIFESIYYSIFFFAVVFGFSALTRKIPGRRLRWVRFTLAACLFHLFVLAPYALGYCPGFFYHTPHKGTILYYDVMRWSERPALLALYNLPKNVRTEFSRKMMYVDGAFPPLIYAITTGDFSFKHHPVAPGASWMWIGNNVVYMSAAGFLGWLSQIRLRRIWTGKAGVTGSDE